MQTTHNTNIVSEHLRPDEVDKDFCRLAASTKAAREWAAYLEDDFEQIQPLLNIVDGDGKTINYAAWDEFTGGRRFVTKKDGGLGSIPRLTEDEKRLLFAMREEAKVNIVRAAYEQTDIDLNAKLSIDDLRHLVKALTGMPRYQVKIRENFINKTLAVLLLRGIPATIRKAYMQAPELFVPHAGFIYTASQEYGKGMQHHVRLNIPNYFDSDGAQQFLNEIRSASTFAAKQLAKVDKRILSYRLFKAFLLKEDMRYAALIERMIMRSKGFPKWVPDWQAEQLRDPSLIAGTWRWLLHRTPQWFIAAYESKFNKMLYNHEYEDKWWFRAIGYRYTYNPDAPRFYEQFLSAV